MSSAAAFDATHISRMAVASIGARHWLEREGCDTEPNSGQPYLLPWGCHRSAEPDVIPCQIAAGSQRGADPQTARGWRRAAAGCFYESGLTLTVFGIEWKTREKS